MTRERDYQPNQEGDFFKEGGKEMYKGPIYHVFYPAKLGAEDIREIMTWGDLGYRIGVAFSYDTSVGFTIPVLGDIPKQFQERFAKAGIKVKLHKERGEAIPA